MADSALTVALAGNPGTRVLGRGQDMDMAVRVQDIVVSEPLDEVVEPLRARWHQLVPLLVTVSPPETEAVRAPLRTALVALEEALLRLGVPLSEDPEDPE